MLDATSKGPEGLLDGNTFSFGNYDECLSTKSKHLGISGGYTLVDIDFRPSAEVYPGFYSDDHSQDYEPHDEDDSKWEVIRVIFFLKILINILNYALMNSVRTISLTIQCVCKINIINSIN